MSRPNEPNSPIHRRGEVFGAERVLPVPLGVIHEDQLRELLTTMGDRFTDEEVDELFREAPIDKKGNFNYAEFTRILKHGAKDKDDE